MTFYQLEYLLPNLTNDNDLISSSRRKLPFLKKWSHNCVKVIAMQQSKKFETELMKTMNNLISNYMFASFGFNIPPLIIILVELVIKQFVHKSCDS